MQKIENKELTIIDEKAEHKFSVLNHAPQIQGQSRGQSIHKNSQIMVFNEEDLQDKQLEDDYNQKLKKGEISSMTKQEYETKCSELKKRIIFGNMSNARNNIIKPQKNFFAETKQKRRESQFLRKNKKSEGKNVTYLQSKNGDVKVDFISPESEAPSQLPKISKNSPELDEQKNMDELPKDKIISKQIQANTKQLKAKENQHQSKFHIQQLKQKSLLRVSNFRDFLYMQLLPSYQIFILVKRTENGLINSTYKFYFQQNKKFIMACEKQGFTKYVFSSSQFHIDQTHISYLGKMDTNFAGSKFFTYDSGEDYSKTKIIENYKKQLAYAHYYQEQNQPIKLSALITTCDNQSTDFTILDKKENILSNRWAMGHRKGISKLTSKQPNYDANDCSYKLNFRGLAGVASTKNFILQNSEYPEALIFGRKSKETYLMRVKAPFSLMQAFSICLSSIHYKFV